MDTAITTVLGTYHTLIQQERSRPHDDLDESGQNRFMAIGPETGGLLNILARNLKTPTIIELGTSFGYSSIWLGEAARASNGRVITMERFEHKSSFARDMAHKAGLASYIDFKIGDAVQMIGEQPPGFDFVFVDLYKDLYVPCLEAFYPKLNPGAIIVADNIISHPGAGATYSKAIRAKLGITSVTLPVGSGLEVSRFDPGI